MKQFFSKLLYNRELAQDYFELAFDWPDHLRSPLPGQFLTILVEDRISPFLRRPFALASFDKAKKLATIIYQRRGPATTLLSQMAPGEDLDILGPRGFPFLLGSGKRPLLLGGGIGTGPMVFAANWLTSKGLRPRLILGFRNKALAPEVHVTSGVELDFCTDDGSLGFKGNVIDFLRSLPKDDFNEAFLWACGPHKMLESAHNFSQEKEIPCQVLMEQVMACAVGACMGCTIDTTDERKVVRVCTEGPVFPSEVVKWT